MYKASLGCFCLSAAVEIQRFYRDVNVKCLTMNSVCRACVDFGWIQVRVLMELVRKSQTVWMREKKKRGGGGGGGRKKLGSIN